MKCSQQCLAAEGSQETLLAAVVTSQAVSPPAMK